MFIYGQIIEKINSIASLQPSENQVYFYLRVFFVSCNSLTPYVKPRPNHNHDWVVLTQMTGYRKCEDVEASSPIELEEFGCA